MMHFHWWRPQGPPYGPVALYRNGAFASQTYACRCGKTQRRDVRVP